MAFNLWELNISCQGMSLSHLVQWLKPGVTGELWDQVHSLKRTKYYLCYLMAVYLSPFMKTEGQNPNKNHKYFVDLWWETVNNTTKRHGVTATIVNENLSDSGK